MSVPAAQEPEAGEWLKGLLLQLVDRAMFDVDDLEAHGDAALHRLRLRMKKADALLQLSKGALRKTARHQLRTQFKGVKNAEGGRRDALVISKLAREIGARRGLRIAAPENGHGRLDYSELRATLVLLRKGLAEQIFDSLTWDDVAENYEASYRSGRRRMREAAQTRDAVAFHRWRKRVKALHYQTQALHDSLSHPRRRLESTRKLAKLLGKEHDLEILAAATHSGQEREQWSELIGGQREELRPKILALGQRLYRQTPQRFARLYGPPVQEKLVCEPG